jgi:hypothetical protein
VKHLHVYVLAGIVAFISVTACGSGSPRIVVPDKFHGNAEIAFCASNSAPISPIIKLNDEGKAISAICDQNLRKYSIRRANGEAIQADIQTVTTGDKLIVSAKFVVP